MTGLDRRSMKYPENIKTPANKSLISSQIIRISISRLNSYTNVFNQQDWESTHIHSITNICFMRFMHKMCSQKPQTQLSPSSTQDPDISRNQNSQNLTDLMQFLTQTALTVHCKPNFHQDFPPKQIPLRDYFKKEKH